MSTIIDHNTEISSAEHLRSTTAAVRVSFTWFGAQKTLTPQQKEQAAESFGAQGQSLSVGKKLLDTRHPRFKAVAAIRTRIVGYWKSVSLPYPESGIRLIRQATVGTFNQQLDQFKAELNEAVLQLDRQYTTLKDSARQRLGSLYNEADYPISLRNLFDVSWEYPSVEPPSYLQQLSPELYQQECRRVAARFDDAVQMAESAFIEELEKLVSHLTIKLNGDEDGKPKIFRDSTVQNLQTFFQRFQQLNIHSSEQLDNLVNDCQQIVNGVQPNQLRTNRQLRQSVATNLSRVQSGLDGLLVDRPRRRIIRSPK